MAEPVSPSRFAKGQYYMHPEDGPIKITGGYYLDPYNHRVSNFFRWTVLRTGEEGCGYGFPMVPLNIKRTVVALPDGTEMEVK